MADLDLLNAWQSQPHVSEWWDAEEPYDAEELGDCRVSRWIVDFDQSPFAYMQDYTVHGWEEHHFAHLPSGARGIDQFIGEPDMIGIGHGSAFIAEGTVGYFVLEACFRHWLTNLSPKTTANWVLASNHSRGGRFHSSAA